MKPLKYNRQDAVAYLCLAGYLVFVVGISRLAEVFLAQWVG